MCKACDYIIAKYPRVGVIFARGQHSHAWESPSHVCARRVWITREYLPCELETLFAFLDRHLDEIIYAPRYRISSETVHYRALKSTFKGRHVARPREYIELYLDNATKIKIGMMHGRSAAADLLDDYLCAIEYYRKQTREAVLSLPQPIAEEIIPHL